MEPPAMPLTFLFRPPTNDAAAVPPVELPFDGQVIRIGRGSACELRLDHASVREAHAIVREQGQHWMITDERSRNGTWVNGVRLSPGVGRAVRDGDLLRVGAVWLQVRVDPGAPSKTGLTTRELALEIVTRCLDVPQVHTVYITEGPDVGGTLALHEDDRAYRIGRSSKCDLHVTDVDVSREHVCLVRHGDAVFVLDLSAKNGVLVGEDRIAPGQAVRWEPSLSVRAGGTVLSLAAPANPAEVSERIATAYEKYPPPEPEPPSNEESSVPPPPATKSTEEPKSEKPADDKPSAATAPVVEVPTPMRAGKKAAKPRSTVDLVVFVGAGVAILFLVVMCVWILSS
jgi:pSer/pThr/pTyr-binding forkhead associated (FHA) protein